MQEIIQLFLKRGFLVESNLTQILSNISKEIEKEFVDLIISLNLYNRTISKKTFLDNFHKINLILTNLKEKTTDLKKKKAIEDILYSLSILLEKTNRLENKNEIGQQLKEEEEEKTKIKGFKGIKILKSFTIPPKKINVGDFIKHFKNRFITLKNLLKDRKDLPSLVSINKITSQRQNISIIGMVFSKHYTKNKNLLLEVEDLTGRTIVLIHQGKKTLFQKAKEISEDEVLGLRCSGNSEILFANEIVFPDLSAKRVKTNYDEYSLFISDLHVGSSNFLEQNFLRFVKWINGEVGSEKQKEIAKKVKYLFVVGDIVDGVGVHPLQEPFLDIKDVKEQYGKTAELFNKIRKDISIIMCPGNHDALRLAEPQPLLDQNFAKSLYDLENILFVSNPSLVSIRGINILLYHGRSFDYYANNIDSLRINNAYHNPRLVQHLLLKKRHLAPTHTSTQYLPCENEDPLMISQIPDVFVSAHLHRSDVSYYNNLLAISCSCWQSKTPLEEKYGHEPDPCKVPILNLKTGKVNIIDFS